jgi:hypothetical protein
MVPIVEIVSAAERYEGVFVSLERTPVLLADVRKNLLYLRMELRKKWAVENVRIDNRIPRVRNPYDPSQIVEAACVGIFVNFTLPALRSAGKKIGEVIGAEIAKSVRRWLRSVGKKKPERRRVSSRARKTGSRR